MSVAFRNVEVHGPVQEWPYEAIVTVIERGTIGDWAMLTRAIRDDPWGPVSRQVEEYLSYEAPYGVAPLLTRAIASARKRRESEEKIEVARKVRDCIDRSGMTITEFAERVGTSRSRLSTYASGQVTPSAAMLLRLERASRLVR